MSTEETTLLQQIATRLESIEKRLTIPLHRTKQVHRNGPAWNAKLDAESVQSIRALLGLGFSQHRLARQFKVSRAAIQAIAEGKTWRNVA